MNNLDTFALADFEQNVKDHVRRVKKSRRPLALTVNGRAEVVLQDAASYQAMLAILEEAESIAAIEAGLQESRQGKGGIRASVFLEKMRKKYKIRAEK
jgi:PHD/YefM family antitoxin component YafN of YafNO toxin-antitoxin module